MDNVIASLLVEVFLYIMRRMNYYFEARQEYLHRTRSVGNALTISLAIAISFIFAFALWLELEFGLLSNFWNSFIR